MRITCRYCYNTPEAAHLHRDFPLHISAVTKLARTIIAARPNRSIVLQRNRVVNASRYPHNAG
jgi:hypothetical protein